MLGKVQKNCYLIMTICSTTFLLPMYVHVPPSLAIHTQLRTCCTYVRIEENEVWFVKLGWLFIVNWQKSSLRDINETVIITHLWEVNLVQFKLFSVDRIHMVQVETFTVNFRCFWSQCGTVTRIFQWSIASWNNNTSLYTYEYVLVKKIAKVDTP